MSNTTTGKSAGRRPFAAVPVLIAAIVVLALVASGSALFMDRHSAKPGTVGKPHLPSVATSSSVPGTTAPPPPLRVVSISPKNGAHSVGFETDVTISFSAPVATNGVFPRLKPAPPGSWVWATPEKLVFHPAGNFQPAGRVKLMVPGGTHGFSSKRGARLGTTVKSSFATKSVSTLRLQQLLAELGYLPVRFVPESGASTDAMKTSSGQQANLASDVEGAKAGTTTTTRPATTTTTRPTHTTTTRPRHTKTTVPPTTSPAIPPGPPEGGTVLVTAPPAGLTKLQEPSKASDIPLTALPGRFKWRFPNIPASLSALWAPGRYNTITTGAVMQFELTEGLPSDGLAGPKVWADLLRAVAHREINRSPYNYVFVSTGEPEYVSLWSDGAVIFKSLANTGIPEAPTEAGTWPVFARFVTTTMKGTNPDGSQYSDPGIPWVSYFHGGDALHGFLRADYGFPQSLGCVELPYSSAQTLFPFTPLGTLVTVL